MPTPSYASIVNAHANHQQVAVDLIVLKPRDNLRLHLQKNGQYITDWSALAADCLKNREDGQWLETLLHYGGSFFSDVDWTRLSAHMAEEGKPSLLRMVADYGKAKVDNWTVCAILAVRKGHVATFELVMQLGGSMVADWETIGWTAATRHDPLVFEAVYKHGGEKLGDLAPLVDCAKAKAVAAVIRQRLAEQNASKSALAAGDTVEKEASAAP